MEGDDLELSTLLYNISYLKNQCLQARRYVKGLMGTTLFFACKNLANNPSLRNWKRLLLHDLVQNAASAVVHLVELINAAHPVIGQHQSTSLENHGFWIWVPSDGSTQTDRRWALALNVRANKKTIFIGVRNSRARKNSDFIYSIHAQGESIFGLRLTFDPSL